MDRILPAWSVVYEGFEYELIKTFGQRRSASGKKGIHINVKLKLVTFIFIFIFVTI